MSIAPPQGIFPANPTSAAAELNLASDLQRDFGASGSAATAIGTISAGSKTVTLEAAQDFRTGQGVFIPNAGPLATVSAPSAPSVSIGGGPSGTSTYEYVAVSLDGLGGASPSSPVGSITTGPSTLGGLGPEGSGQGEDIGGASWLSISLNAVSGATAGYAIYRTSAPSGSDLQTGFIGIYTYLNTPFLDYGQAIQTPPPGVPATPPSGALGQSLVSTIVAGGGTTQITLADTAATSVTNGVVFHDDSQAVSQFLADPHPKKYIPPGTYGISQAVTLEVDGATLIGAGDESVLKYQANTNATLIVEASQVRIEGIRFEGQRVVQTLVTLGTSSDLHGIQIADCRLHNPVFYGILAASSSTTWSSDLEITRVRALNCEYAIAFSAFWERLRITENTISFNDYNASGRGVSLHNTPGYQRHWTVANNVLRCGNHTAAIVVQGSGLGTISGNVCLVSGGIFAIAAFGDNTAVEQTSGYSIANNYCEALWGGTGVGVSLTNVVQISVSDNILYHFGYAYELGYPGSPGYTDAVANNVRFQNNQLLAIAIAAWNGTVPLSAQFENNAGQNPLGALTPPASPLVSGTVYQNTFGVPITIYQPAYATTSGTAGSVAVSSGSTGTPKPNTLYTQYIPGDSSSGTPMVCVLRVPPGWYYSFLATGAVLQEAAIQGE